MDDEPVWHENPAFWDAFRNFMFPPEKYEQAPEQVDRVLDLADVEPTGHVLDVPCGVGRHAAPLAERGFDVTAVDATERYLDDAREHAAETSEAIEFVHADMREFQRPETFDAVFNLYTSFGYFEDRRDDERTARNFYESLKPGGTLVMSLAAKEILAGKFEERSWEERDGAYLLEEREVTDDWTWMKNQWHLVVDGDGQSFTVSHRLYSAYELSELLRRVGFSDVAAYGDLEGAPYDTDAERLVVVAEK
ncbi:MAG TPA: class I SAM-dependent methyltransferase [Natrialbaceae archaeon]|nr:class I SAM-dependent methyltransferase [Natrialbaceae archaeon]